MIARGEERIQFDPEPTPSGLMLRVFEPLYAVGKQGRGEAERTFLL
jgi:hypothetical protein